MLLSLWVQALPVCSPSLHSIQAMPCAMPSVVGPRASVPWCSSLAVQHLPGRKWTT